MLGSFASCLLVIHSFFQWVFPSYSSFSSSSSTHRRQVSKQGGLSNTSSCNGTIRQLRQLNTLGNMMGLPNISGFCYIQTCRKWGAAACVLYPHSHYRWACHAVNGPPPQKWSPWTVCSRIIGPPGLNITAILGPPLPRMVPPLAWCSN